MPFLPSLLHARLDHKKLTWGRATISRSAETTKVKVPAGSFDASVWTVAEEGGRTFTYDVEAAAPFRGERAAGGLAVLSRAAERV